LRRFIEYQSLIPHSFGHLPHPLEKLGKMRMLWEAEILPKKF